MSTTKILEHPDVTILGGGPIGLLAALCLARRLPEVRRIRLIAGRKLPPADGRAAAIVGRSMQILDGLTRADGTTLDAIFRDEGAPLASIRIIDVTGRLLRAPTTNFHARDTGQAHFGISLTTQRIVALLREATQESGRIEILPVDIKAITRQESGFTLTDDQGKTHVAPFLLAADGQRSLAREAAGIAVKRWSYPQMALTFSLKHQRDHHDISTEFHTNEGPFTLVPAGYQQSTVVWMMGPETAERLLALDDIDFARAAEKTCRSLLGAFSLTSPRGSYPMGGLLAERFVDQGIALLGETAHAFPPIGAQGLNLGFRDADTLADALVRIFAAGEDLSTSRHLMQWERERRRDVTLRTASVDAFNRSLLTDFLPVTVLRSLGLFALNSIPPLRRSVMRAGLAQ